MAERVHDIYGLIGAMPKVLSAYEVAARAHDGQKRRVSGEPYINHPFRVMMTVMDTFNIRDPDVLCAALLHDVLEDTGMSADDIREMFGDGVAGRVEVLSKRKEAFDLGTYFDGIRNTDVGNAAIKVADRIDNLRDGAKAFKNREKLLDYVNEAEQYIMPLAHEVGRKASTELLAAIIRAKESSA
jgi:GTP pyrophosphokinase